MKANSWKEEYPEFNPDYTPVEMFKLGIFGGNYFDEYVGLEWTNFVPDEFMSNFSIEEMEELLSDFDGDHDFKVSKFKVECGSNYNTWKENDWIEEELDPYGWVNWYINFFYGRRSYDDDRQIGRWKSFKARHSGMLRSYGDPKDLSHSLKTRQNLLQWAVNSELV